ncbi:ABC transporter substrate-binding protein [Pikeienuella piscinae]|uniref:ABC transporter substrate-binding protein n=1 Tax=Pikeienuella piscinae TaxID=2748098 RepID=A0A7L5BVR3_9RHOB|nr:ABC transporter substrate-binding protein [Pikeienuella piscinae]QIE54908.1 ABC transporter substrate-binding protein [Pikeienuella piscinae]
MSFKMDRRQVMQTGAAAGALAMARPAFAAGPQRGGTLRMGVTGANTSDSWDGRTHSDTYMQVIAHGAVFDCLTEVAADGSLKGELAENWEASSDAKTWTFNFRKGVTFHNGKDFNADDVIESLALHTAADAKSAAKPIVENIEEMKKTDTHQIQFTLKAGNADFPYLLSDYHILIYPAGMVEEAISKGIGTGGYKVENFEPGQRALVSKYENYYNDAKCFFDSVEQLAINDSSARMNALMTSQVDAISRVDFKTESLLTRNPGLALLEVTGNMHYTFPMLVKHAPFDDLNVRKALKHAFDRQELVDKILQGHGAIANDHPIGPANQYYAADLPQNEYDPDKAKHFLKEAGMDSLTVDLSVSNAAFVGAVDSAQLAQNSAAACGITINLIKEPDDGYWSNVWLKKPWCVSYWSGRATEDWMFSSVNGVDAPWNETGWVDDRFQKLLVEARTTLDSDKRREMYREMQAIESADGGVVIPMYANTVDAHSVKLAHPEQVGNLWPLDSARIAERWWYA